MTTVHTLGMGTYGATWSVDGYAGQGNVEELIGTLEGRAAIVAGTADGVFNEVAMAEYRLRDRGFTEPAVILAVNDVGMFLPRVDHWVSLHANHLTAWKAVRWLHPHADERARYHSIDPGADIEFVWTGLTPLFALSGYFAMQIAYCMGAERIVLCGCPGESRRRFFEENRRTDFGYGEALTGREDGIRAQVRGELTRVPKLAERVRSMSGWTRDMFGRL